MKIKINHRDSPHERMLEVLNPDKHTGAITNRALAGVFCRYTNWKSSEIETPSANETFAELEHIEFFCKKEGYLVGAIFT